MKSMQFWQNTPGTIRKRARISRSSECAKMEDERVCRPNSDYAGEDRFPKRKNERLLGPASKIDEAQKAFGVRRKSVPVWSKN
jgi:hypothetical protein